MLITPGSIITLLNGQFNKRGTRPFPTFTPRATRIQSVVHHIPSSRFTSLLSRVAKNVSNDGRMVSRGARFDDTSLLVGGRVEDM